MKTFDLKNGPLTWDFLVTFRLDDEQEGDRLLDPEARPIGFCRGGRDLGPARRLPWHTENGQGMSESKRVKECMAIGTGLAKRLWLAFAGS